MNIFRTVGAGRGCLLAGLWLGWGAGMFRAQAQEADPPPGAPAKASAAEPAVRSTRRDAPAPADAREARSANQEGLRAMKEKLGRLHEQLQELVAAGHEEPAGRVKVQIAELERQLRLQAGQPNRAELQQQLQKRKAQIAEWRENGRDEEADRLERETRGLAEKLQAASSAPRQPSPARRPVPVLPGAGGGNFGPGPDGFMPVPPNPMRWPRPEGFGPGQPGGFSPAGPGTGEPERRWQHFQTAIQNLNAAGLPELAQRLAHLGQRWQRQMGGWQRPQPPVPGQPPGPWQRQGPGPIPGPWQMRGPGQMPGPAQFQAAPRELQELQAAVNELRQTVRQLRRQMEELARQRGAN